MHNKHTRRNFLKATASSLLLGGCGFSAGSTNNILHGLTDRQKANKFKGISEVALIRCPSYEENISGMLKKIAHELMLPDFQGKTVIVKPNMIEFFPHKPLTTNPAMIAAVCELVDYLGAREVIVAEGPGHFRDTEYLLEVTGFGKVCRQLGVRFVDLNLDDIERVNNLDGIMKAKTLFLPKTVLEADALVSLPKLKTHHWVGVTASMKNLFGTVPGCKYGWPKNFLHWQGIPQSIIDLNRLIKPAFAVVDAVEAMEGDGPVNGTVKHSGFIAVGKDLASVDATCARAMSLDPSKLEYLQLAGAIVGNIDQEKIKVSGASINDVRQKFEMPITFLDPKYMHGSTESGS